MKSIYRPLGIIFLVLFMISALVYGWFLMEHGEIVQDTYKKVPGLGEVILVVITSGLFGFFFLLISANQRIDVIYVKDIDQQDGNNSGSDDGTGNKKKGLDDDVASSVSMKIVEEIILKNQYNKRILLERFLQSICDYVEASLGAIYITKALEDSKVLEMVVSYAYYGGEGQVNLYEFGQGLVGQVAKNGKPINLSSIPEGYVQVMSGLGSATPSNLIIYPIKNEEEEVLGVIEMASFKLFEQTELDFLREVALLLAKEIETNEYYNLNL